MKPVEIIKNIYGIRTRDWNIRDFHGYSTERGSSYNAYLITGQKNVLIDTAKAPFASEFIESISQIIDPKKIDIVISNHTEMDHSGSLPAVMHKIGESKPLYCSEKGAENLKFHFGDKWDFRPVKDLEELKIGTKTLQFIETRMLHWPDSMFTYIKEDNLLFSSDAFGQHYSGIETFDDEVGHTIMPHAKKYFANILLPYSKLILKLVEKVSSLGIKLDIICPDHGIIWRKDPGAIINNYVKWANQTAENKAVITYDSMWNSTKTMAEKIAEGIYDRSKADVKIMHIRSFNRSDIITQIIDARSVIVGSPTLNNQIFPTVADILTYVKGLRPVGKIGAAFGSYGWSGEAVKIITKEIESMGFSVPVPGLKLKYVPDNDGKKQSIEFGQKIGEAML